MRRFWIIGLACAGGIALIGGCDNTKKDDLALLTEENQTLRSQLDERSRAVDACDSERRQQSMRIADLERQLADARGAGAQPMQSSTPFEGIEGVTGVVTLTEITAVVEGDVLFDSGKIVLKPGAKRTLDQVAQVLASNYGGRHIVIEGHTDTDPIKRSGYKSNYHLGFERAYAVREYLIGKGIPASTITLASDGPNDPQSTKALSRRVEIIIPN